MRLELRARALSRDARVGRHFTGGWLKTLCQDICEATGWQTELVTWFEGDSEYHKIVLFAVGATDMELVFDADDTLGLFHIGPDRIRAPIVGGTALWASTWLDVLRALKGQKVFRKKNVCGRYRQLVT